MVRKVIRDILLVTDTDITTIERTPGGMTNDSYFVTVGVEKFVVRLPGKGTDQLIDRRAERDNLIYGTKIGINPELIYFDVESGIKITRKIEGAATLTPSLAREAQMMKNIIALFQRLHDSDTVMKNRFELFPLINHYENLVRKENTIMLEKLAPLKEDILALEEIYQSFHVIEAPCHIDAVCSNFMIDGKGELSLIDWEYSGMFDPMWDIATLFLSLHLTDEEELFFLKYYLQRDPTEEEIQRVLMQKIFLDYMWSLWSFYKDAQGDDYAKHAFERIERVQEHIALYKSLYEEDVVV